MSRAVPDLQRIEELIQEIEATSPPNFRTLAIELIESLMSLHGAGLERVIEIVSDAGETGDAIIDTLGRDQLLSPLLVLYDLHPESFDNRIERALEKIRSQLRHHHGDIELIGIEDRFIRLRLKGNCHSCPSSMLTMKNLIEQVLYESAADLAGIEVLGLTEETPSAGFVPLDVFEGNSAALVRAQ